MKDIEEIITSTKFRLKKNVKSKRCCINLSKFIGQETDVSMLQLRHSSKNILVFINDELFVATRTECLLMAMLGRACEA